MGLFGNKKQKQEKYMEREVTSAIDIIAPASIEVHPNYIKLEEKLAKTYFVFSYPRYLTTGWLSPIINMDIEALISTLYSHYNIKPIVVDCDFCKTAITEIDKLHNILNIMQKHQNHGAVLWTLASRKCPDEKTFSLLNEYIFDGSLEIQGKCYNGIGLIEYYHTQNKFTASKIVSYRDGKCAMKTGYIVW